EAERPGGLEVDHQLVPRGVLHRQISGFLPPENAIDIASYAPELIDVVRPVADQAAIAYEKAIGINRGQPMASGKRDNYLAMDQCQAVRQNDQGTVRGACEFGDRVLDLGRIAHVDWNGVQPQRGGDRLDCTELPDPAGYGWIAQDCHARRVRRDLFDQ